MKRMQEYLAEFLEFIEVPTEARPSLTEASAKLLAAAETELSVLCGRYMEDPAEHQNEVFERLDAIAETGGVDPLAASFVFLCWNSRELWSRYEAAGISRDIFHQTMMDLHYKLMECKRVKGVWGTFVRTWDAGFFAMTRFALGRLQYEFRDFMGKSYEACGYTVREGDKALIMHIPSAGPLTGELREDSYRRAYEFYKDQFPGRPVVFTCSSWLLFPPHREMIPGSNIVSFMDDFDPVSWKENDEFHDAWRIYGAAAGLPPEQLPRDTAIQRAYADRLAAGQKTGSGYGIFLFDGTNFLRKSGAREHL